jgi:hypothetical protein
MATNAYRAKRALIRRLRQVVDQAQPGSPLHGVQVDYAWPGLEVAERSIYGGGVVFDQDGEDDVYDGPDRLAHEVATVGLLIRVMLNPPPDGSDGEPSGVEASDLVCEEIGRAVKRVLVAEPRLAGPNTVARIRSGQGDYNQPDGEAVSLLAIRVDVESYVDGE